MVEGLVIRQTKPGPHRRQLVGWTVTVATQKKLLALYFVHSNYLQAVYPPLTGLSCSSVVAGKF